MNKIVSLIIIALFVAMGTTQAGGVTFQSDSPESHGCRTAMPMDCCSDLTMQPHQTSGQADCCGAPSSKTYRASSSVDRTFSAEPLSDCQNSFCKLPVQPPDGIVDSPRHLSNGGSLQAQQYAPEFPPSQRQAAWRCLPERTGPPVPLYTRYCVLRY